MLILNYGNNIAKTETVLSVDQSVPTTPDLQDFWNVETIGIKEKMNSCDDEVAMKKFKDSLVFKDDRYYVTWPWRCEIPEIPENRALAIGRLRSLVSKLKSRPEVMKKYDSVIEEQLSKGMIEKVNRKSLSGIRHYIPHQAVIKPDNTTTKLRIVFGASAKTKSDENSLNESLYRGPVLLQDLCGILMRFRLHNIGLTSDIEKAFLQIGLQESERDVTRFVWLKDPENPSVSVENIQEFRFCRVPFGIISSPFLLGATVDYHLDTYDNDIANQLKQNIYMDNVITGTDSVDDAVMLYRSSKKMFSDASMNLREWASNSESVKESIEVEDRAEGETMKVLGLVWNKKKDRLSLKPITPRVATSVTKRIVLKEIASVFDPLGLYSPVVLKGKILLQDLWRKQLDSDTCLDEEDVHTWLEIRSDLISISNHEIPRCITADSVKSTRNDILCFCDASCKAYATAIYLMQTVNEERKIELIFAKSRLVPTKDTTIPRLELMAVLIGVRCIAFVKKHIGIQIENIHLFSDSKCTLSWIASTKQLPVFVANRVKEIKSHKDVNFHYVQTKSNSADIASRGCTLTNLTGENMWWHGPEWLVQSCEKWPIDGYSEVIGQSVQSEFKTNESEVHDLDKKEQTMYFTINNEESTVSFPVTTPLEIDCERFSSLTKLLRVTGLVLRFIKRLKGEQLENMYLTANELDKAEKMWVIHRAKKELWRHLHCHYRKEKA